MEVQIRKYKPTDAWLKVLIYGKPGVGKTSFGITAPKPLYIQAEGGLLSVAEFEPEYIEVKTMAELNAAYELLEGGDHEYETVIIDSLTEIQSTVMKRITGDKAPRLEDWGVFSPEMARILRNFRDLPMHVVFLCLEDNDGKDEPYYIPQLYGKLGERACGFMDFVGRMGFYKVKKEGEDVATSERGISFHGCEKWTGKDRSRHLPKFAPPTFAEITKAISNIKVGKQKVVRELEGDNTTAAIEAHDHADIEGGDNGKKTTRRPPKPEESDRPTPPREVPADREEITDKAKKPPATNRDMKELLDLMDGATSEKELDGVRDNYVIPQYTYTPDQTEELSSFGKECRQRIRDGQIKMPIPEVDYTPDVDTARAAEELFGTSKESKKTPPKKKSPPNKKTRSTLEKLTAMKR